MANETPTTNPTPDTTTPASDATGEQKQGTTDQTEAKQAATTEAARKYKVLIDGEESEVEEAELLRGYQIRKASDKKFSEAARMRKEADALVELLREDPVNALTHPSVGHDFRKLAEKYLTDVLEDEMAPPEEKEKRAKLRRMEELEKENTKLKADFEERRMAQLTEQYKSEYQNKIVDALDKGGLPKTNHTVKRMAYYMQQALENDYDLEPRDVIDLVRKDYLNEIKDIISASDGQVLLDLLGEETANKIRKFDISRVSGQQVASQKQEEAAPSKAKEKKMTMDEFSEYLKSISD